MKAAICVFPGSNCDRDLAVAFRAAGFSVEMVWHKETTLPEGVDVVGLPGGFSYGDYLRAGAIAARSPVCRAVADHAVRGGYVLGICNGFQILTETAMLPGALVRNAGIKYICRPVPLLVGETESPFTRAFDTARPATIPIAHHDGNYTADDEVLGMLRGEGRIAFTYAENPNGARHDIAGILSANGRVLGIMPHPERAADPALGSTDGLPLFQGLAGAFAPA
ncbi:phosphoribosylformylglycinamidine synthase subunit PurQ [Palleronia sediminis]|uniref:Phosphoribosylformylglycinamidine synthase subunit PurQ n=1 Tax=Palleronia sediminis TaxID=2547833 RepID=A0A4R6AKG3_9RHOB|nr:phosphoribosylformylglycinamidine synthase subunit PurQ [Palleronia sediminis]TDL84087.1 phosphoribosylformylglycinamidine synthase subunit PurQ [Palleronia sediminis]